MKKDRVFFQTGLFEKPFLNSRITTASMTMKEKILGYLIGPVGILALVAIVNQLLELYYTEVFYIDEIFGAGNYLLMSWVTKAVGIVAGLLIAYVVEHNVSSQGRIRPMVLIGCLFSAVSSFFLFYIPDMANWAKLAWVYVFNILFNGFGSALLALRVNLFTLCTRNQNDRNLVNLFEKVSSYLLVGTAVTLTVGSVLYYTMLHGHPAENWYGLVGIAALASIPLSLVHYYYTKERVTLENASANQSETATTISLLGQIKALFTSKYWLMATSLTVIIGIANNLAGYNLNTNFCTVILGATAENSYNSDLYRGLRPADGAWYADDLSAVQEIYHPQNYHGLQRGCDFRLHSGFDRQKQFLACCGREFYLQYGYSAHHLHSGCVDRCCEG